jgi:NTE family protein
LASEPDTHPVSPVEPDREDKLEKGIALCLSGGGYRAMLFHVGALWRLNQLGYLPRLDRISSVSGGSITAACLGLHWDRLGFGAGGVAGAFGTQLVDPIRALARRTLDVKSGLGGIFTRGTVAEKVADAYAKYLYGTATLKALPDAPRFVINATNLQTGSLVRFCKPYLADYRIGLVNNPSVPLATVVAASAAFPPFLSPLRLELPDGAFAPAGRGPLARPPFSTKLVLSDGGVYDNLGLETAWKRYTTILISDGGGQMQPADTVSADWVRQGMRVTAVIDNQVRSLRKRAAIAGYLAGDRDGAYWSVRSDVNDYGPPAGSLPCPSERTQDLAATKTRLAALDDDRQERLINWGYAICDIAIRKYVDATAPAPPGFPYPRGV